LIVEVGKSTQASLVSATVVEQFARASQILVVEPISEVEQDLVFEVERELFSLSV
jgi:hypothetical protein